MKIAYMSDLHLEMMKNRFKGDLPEVDIMVLAGDISVGQGARELVERCCKKYSLVLYSFGNHEYYNKVIEDVESYWYGLEETFPNLKVAGTFPRLVNYKDTDFFLGTMWTDLKDPQQAYTAEYYMNDYRMIFKSDSTGLRKQYVNGQKVGTKTISAEDTTKYFNRYKYELGIALSKSKADKFVCVSHHAPHILGISTEHSGSNLNPAYYTDMSEFFDRVNVWIHGHTHKRYTEKVDNCLLASNAQGYIISGRKELDLPFRVQVLEL